MVAIGLTDYYSCYITIHINYGSYLELVSRSFSVGLGGFLKLLSIARNDYLHEDITCFTPPDSEVVFPERPGANFIIVTHRCYRLTPFSHSSQE
jgi:hypothetical protein